MYRIIKNDASEEKDRFVSHLFQEIDVGEPLASRGEAAKGFEPADVNGKPGFCSDSEKDAVDNGPSIEDITKSAYEEGFLAGEKRGRESERENVQHILDTFDNAFRELGKLKEALRSNAEKGAVELALGIAEKVISHEVSVNREILLGVVKGALDKVVEPEGIKVRVNPSDLQFINDYGCQIPGLTDNPKDVIIEGDVTISRGGCVIETGFGSIDARIENQVLTIGDLLRLEMPQT